MDFEKAWDKALRHTEIIRSRVSFLKTHASTQVPYIFLSESTLNLGDTVVRKGEVLVERPAIIVPPNNPQLSGFDLEAESAFNQDSLINFLLVRGITLPSLKYDNRSNSLDIFEGKLNSAIKHYETLLLQQENVNAGLICGPDDCWQFSVLIFICAQVSRNAEMDIRKLLDEFHKRKND